MLPDADSVLFATAPGVAVCAVWCDCAVIPRMAFSIATDPNERQKLG